MPKSKEKIPNDSEAVPCGPLSCIKKKEKKKEGGKKEKAMKHFITDVLPSLKKELSKQKKVIFTWKDYAEYFKPEANFLATYLIPLLRFLNKTSIVCTRYGCFDGKHRVKTSEGFDKVVEITKHEVDDKSWNGEMQRFISQKFGREWFKIPSRDGHKAKLAFESSPDGKFLITIISCVEDYFFDADTGKKIRTINPILIYEPIMPAVVNSPSHTPIPTAKKTKKAGSVDSISVLASNSGNVETLDTQISPVVDYEDSV